MISTALFLTAGLMASPVIIQDVKASREAGHLRVEIAGDGGIDPDGARTRIDGDVLLIYLGGTRVRVDNRSWDLADGAGEIKAHRHKFETELVVPLAGNGCTGPVELQGSDTGITALVGCDGTVAATTEPKIKAKSKTNADTLKALVELPSETVPVVAAAKVPPKAEAVEKVDKVEKLEKIETKTEVKAETHPAKVEPTAAKSDPKPVVEAKFEAKKVADLLVAPVQAPAPAGNTAGGGMKSIGMPAALLALLAVGAYLLARRRRTISVRHIQILETASLGPKRSLVVARVGDETLILGISEAGITLLKNGAGLGSFTSTPAAAAVTTASLGELEAVLANSSVAGKTAKGAAQPATNAATPVATKAATKAAAKAAAKADAVAAAEAEAAASAFEISQPLEEALADIPEPGDTVGNARTTARGGFRAIEGGLAGLLNDRLIETSKDEGAIDSDGFPFETRSPARRGARSDERSGLKDRLKGSERRRVQSRDDSFEDLLEDSIEDQELRQKLAAGMSARVR